MKNKVIGILGGKGQMAGWFIRHFSSEFKEVLVHDLNPTESLQEFIEQSDLILITVPISKTTQIIEDIAPYCREEQLVFDFTSLKEAPCKAMETLKCGAIGMHPLFGPKLENLNDFHLVFCEVHSSDWSAKMKTLFESQKLSILEMSPKEHDEKMAWIQALNHGMHLINGIALSKHPFSNLKIMQTPSFSIFLKGLENIIQGNPKLYFEIASQNPYSKSVFNSFKSSLEEYIECIESKDESRFVNWFKGLQKWSEGD